MEQADAVRNSMAELEGEIEKLAEKYRDVQKYILSVPATVTLSVWLRQRRFGN